MRTNRELVGDVAVLAVLEPRLDGARGSELRSVVATLVAEGHRFVVLDLSAVNAIDSTGLGAIVSARKLVDRSGALALCVTTEAVMTLFRLTRMDKVFDVFPSRPEAIRAVATKACIAS
jgi:anti-sigma B factor antagonist